MAGKGSRPGERRGGRQAGTPNQLPDLRAITLKALMKAGGVDYLVRQADMNPMGFLSLLGRVMPRESHVELSGELRVRQEVRRDLVEKLIVLMREPAETKDETSGAVIEGKALPAITHNADSMLKAQAIGGREGLSRRAENARRESTGTVAGAVQRAAAMHMERSAMDGSSIGESPADASGGRTENGSGDATGSGAGGAPRPAPLHMPIRGNHTVDSPGIT